MLDTSPFSTVGFIPPGRAYRLLSLGVTPLTPIGYGAQTEITLMILLPALSAHEPTIPMNQGVARPVNAARRQPQRTTAGGR